MSIAMQHCNLYRGDHSNPERARRLYVIKNVKKCFCLTTFEIL